MLMKNNPFIIKNNKLIQYLLITILCFFPDILYINKLGYYWDDWSQLFLHYKFGDAAFWEYFSYNRPLSAWTDIMFFPICGNSPVKWHILILVLKTCLCILFLKILSLTFRENKTFVNIAVVLFAVCPLFSQTYIAIAYSQHFTDYILFALSVYCLLKFTFAQKKWERFVLYFLSTIFMVLHLSITEYFAFLEILKVPLVFIVIKNQNKKLSLKKIFAVTIKYCILHILLFVIYCFYRFNISKIFVNFDAETPDLIYLFLNSPVSGAYTFLKNTLVNFLYPFTGFISNLFNFNLQTILSKTEILSLLVSFFVSLPVWFFIAKQSFKEELKSKKIIILICACAAVLGFLPFVIMNENYLNTDDFTHADRTFLASVPFFCLMFTVILAVLFSSKRSNTILISFTVFLFCHAKVTVCNEAQKLTNKQNDFYHQISIRIPGIQDGTAIVDDTIIFPEQGNFSTASALNILYPNDIRENGDVPLWVFSYWDRPKHEHGSFHVQNRVYHFNQPPTDYIYIDHDNQFANCVWIFNNTDTDNPHISDIQKGWIESTNLNLIKFDSEFEPDHEIFGNLSNEWCGYYQKAALLQQQKDWKSLSDLTDIVLYHGYSPSNIQSNSSYEWWPFIEGLLQSGRMGKAQELSEEAIKADGAYRDFYEKRLSAFQ